MRLWLALAFLPAFSAPAFRLPDTVRPDRYRLDLTVLADQPTLRGRVAIEVTISLPTDTIWLHAKDLTVRSANVQTASQRLNARAEISGGEFLSLKLQRPLAGKATLNIDFTAKLDDKLAVGAYRRSDGRDWYAFTTFTAIEARRAFPCFDQPEFKTPWDVTLRVRSTDTAISNTRALSETPESDGTKRVVFATTKPLPSEVIAFAAGPFDIVDDGVAGRAQIPVRIIAAKGRGAQASGVRGATRDVLARIEDYTAIPYPWDKLDHLAVFDMPFDAVENPGLITYRERSLLATPERDTAEHRDSLRKLMCHELVHQWFGNLVTQRWWDDVWLSEGFSTWLSTKLSDRDLPPAQHGLAAVESRARIMARDGRAVRVDMQSRDQMNEVYSGIVYQKAGAILRMVEHWIGEEPFRRSLQRYLKTHAGSTATTADLAAAIQEETGADVRPVFTAYLDQPGFPSLNVTLDCAAKTATVRHESALPWVTPVCTKQGCTVVRDRPVDIPVSSCPAWINSAGAGYFRTQGGFYAALIKSGWNTLTAAERLSVVADIVSLPATDQVAILPALLRDRDPHVRAEAHRLALQLALHSAPAAEALRKVVNQ